MPIDPDACPTLGAGFAPALEAALRSLRLELRPGVRAGIEAQVRLLLAWSVAINLTAIRTPQAIALEHVADALTAVAPVRAADLGERPAVLDLGSGAGYPGLPLGLALPAGRLTLVDSVAKKARFLRVAGTSAIKAARTGGEVPPDFEVVAERAETLGRDDRHRGRYDLVAARAVGSLSELVELALPLLRAGGCLVAWKREAEVDGLSSELASARPLLSDLDGTIDSVEAVTVPGLADHRLVFVRAERPTPARYPRSPAERRRGRR